MFVRKDKANATDNPPCKPPQVNLIYCLYSYVEPKRMQGINFDKI